MTPEELKRYDGRDGRPAYIAYKDKVYDVSESPLWREGNHQGMHRAGTDLTDALAEAPHGDEVFARFPVVGTYERPKQETPKRQASPEKDDAKASLRMWYRKYHPHPMAVHFPIALHLFAAFADLLFLFNRESTYAAAVFYTFFIATVMGLVAMIPGMLSWWINYGFSKQRPFVVKVIVSVAMLLLGIVGIALYLENPAIVYETSFEGIVYHAIVLLTGAGVIVLGYYGGKITWGDMFATDTPAAADAPPREENMMEEKTSDSVSLPRAGRYELPFAAVAGRPAVTLPGEGTMPEKMRHGKSVAVLIGGAAGQGIDTLEQILDDALRRSGYYIFSSKEFMSRVRGGSNMVLIRVSDAPVEAACWEVDLFIALDAPALEHAAPRLGEKTLVITDEGYADKREGAVGVPLKADAKALGIARYENTYAAGIVYGLFGLDTAALHSSVASRFDDEGNAEAVKQGADQGRTLPRASLPPLPEPTEDAGALHLMDGTAACGFGFLAGGCNFVASYPMSPSTGVLNFMAAQSKRFAIAVEQSEDEIASIHMVMGAWYAGARGLTTTSGGGFALMGEGISLSGMTETPAVVYLAQRPGPATGLPTRSEQGDLNLALHSGHGPFPRILLAPGSLRECIEMGYLAFELADRWQVPVILLSDQYLADSTAMIGDIDFSVFEARRYVVETDGAYRRYEDTPDGVSPRGVPGYGDGLVCSDGHEHDERGQITEDFRVRDRMVAKRERKAEGIAAEALPPEASGSGSIAVIGWGSTRSAIAEAVARLNDGRLAQVHFAWVHPLDPEALKFLGEYTHRIVVENNADGAFADRLTLNGVQVDRRILQSNGFAYFADQLSQRLSDILKELS